MHILLTEWAAKHYSPPPSLWTLRLMARRGEIHPAPVKRGRQWYVDEHARDLAWPAQTLVQRLERAA